MRQFFASVLEILEIALVAIAAVFIIRSFLIQPFLVSGTSMIPNFSDGDYLLIDELTYHFRAPKRGEVSVFKSPIDASTYFIKRIIGLPGETIKIKEGNITVFDDKHPEGSLLNESYLSKSVFTKGDEEFKLKGDEYLMLGDNRSFSFDSRSWGPLKANAVVGLVRFRLWPLNELHAFAAPQY